MFQFVGAIVRLPFALLAMLALVLTWPIGLGFIALVYSWMVLWAPFVFVGAAFSNDRRKWDEHVEGLDLGKAVDAVIYPIHLGEKLVRWVSGG